MNILIDNRYCDRFIHLRRPIFPENHNGTSLCLQSRPHLGSRMRLSVLNSQGFSHPICELSRIITTRQLDALTVLMTVWWHHHVLRYFNKNISHDFYHGVKFSLWHHEGIQKHVPYIQSRKLQQMASMIAILELCPDDQMTKHRYWKILLDVMITCQPTWAYFNRSVAPPWVKIDGLVQERCNSIANVLELRLSCTNPSRYYLAYRYTYLSIFTHVCQPWSASFIIWNPYCIDH